MKQVIPQTQPDFETTRVIERPDGFYWQATDGVRDYGPFATLLAAVNDMQANDSDEESEPIETLQEAESEIGIADWMDPETGEPAEEGGTRIAEP